jgi:hypothetical protein
MDAVSARERSKYELMWSFAEYRDDHVTSHARNAVTHLGLRAGDSIIDFGAGAGYASAWLKTAGLRVLAIDIAANAMASEVKERVPLLVSSLWELPVALSGDWGFCCDVMEHIPPDRVDDVLRVIRSSTRRSTYFGISLRRDGCGRLIDETLHLSVEPAEWWVGRVEQHWNKVRIVHYEPQECVVFVAEGGRDHPTSTSRPTDGDDRVRLTAYAERMAELAQQMAARGVRECLVFGCAQTGRAFAAAAPRFGLKVIAFVRSGAVVEGETVDGLPVRSIAEASSGTCHTYAIGSFSSAPAMIAALEACYRGGSSRYCVNLPEGPAPEAPGGRLAEKVVNGPENSLPRHADSTPRHTADAHIATADGPRWKPRHVNYVDKAYEVAALESATYLVARMQAAADFITAAAVREHALAQCEVNGLVLEFGVADGGSLRQISALTAQQVHGFDSFEGLPEDWTHFQKKGRFSRTGAPPVLNAPHVRLHKGWFDETLPAFLFEHEEPARFIHIDCDLYSSTHTVLGLLGARIVPGTVIVFDEYLNYPGWQSHEHKAFAEFIERSGARYRYLGFASSECAVSVRIL